MHWANEVKQIVQSMMSRVGVPRWGIVQSVNPAIPTVTVTYQPDGVLSGPLPVKCLAAGSTNIIALPNVGDMVQIHPDNGDMENGVVSLAAHNASATPPTSPATGKVPQAGEFYINVGTAYIHATNGTIYLGGKVVLAGAMTATGNITAGQGTSDQVDVLNHTHQYIPGSNSPAQTQPPTAGT